MQVYRLNEYEALPRFELLPGEPGFQAAFPHLDLPDELLAAAPPYIEIVGAIADGHLDDLLKRYRENVLELKARHAASWLIASNGPQNIDSA